MEHVNAAEPADLMGPARLPVIALLLMLTLLQTGGCTSYQRVDVDRERLHQELRAGNVARVGEWIDVTLDDGTEHRFQVTGIRDDVLLGEDREIPIDRIESAAVRDFSAGRTGALVGGISVAWLVLIAVALSSMTFMM